MRGEGVEAFNLENCYNWAHQLYQRYAQKQDCPGGVNYGYAQFYPSVMPEWMWSVSYPHTFWIHKLPFAYMKIGHRDYWSFYTIDLYPLDDLYPQEVGKGF